MTETPRSSRFPSHDIADRGRDRLDSRLQLSGAFDERDHADQLACEVCDGRCDRVDHDRTIAVPQPVSDERHAGRANPGPWWRQQAKG